MPQPGESLTHFRLVEQIGEGGMGTVWKAVDTKLDREVAVKILPHFVAADADRLARFQREAKTVAALNHPNIVTIYSVEEDQGVHFLAMELVRGRSLDLLIPDGGLSLDELFKLALPITDAICAAHAQGITHRDLKPRNIMVADDGRAKVLDFGIAGFRDDEPGSGNDPDETPTVTLTQTSEVYGTLSYMSPEQIQGKTLDHRTDVFSLGVVLYQMAAGRRPFAHTTTAELIAAILRDYPRPVTDFNQRLPRQLQRIIGHSMQKDRERRMQTVRDLHNQLEALRNELETGELSPGALTQEAAPQGRGLRSLAVLPLENLSGDDSQEFFADGMTDALITDLAKIEGLKVISRTSVMQYKGAKKALREIARELDVGAIVEGSVMRVGDRVRIVAQLLDASTDEHLWAERYDRDACDVLALQSEVAQAIAAQVQCRLTEQDQARLASTRTVNPEAHEACLRGRHFWYKRTPDSVKKGLESFEKAIELDPGYAPAYAGLADSYLVDGGGYLGIEPKVAYDRAREAAQKAVELDANLSEAHTSLAAVVTDYDWDWEAGEAAFQRAIELNPNYVVAHYWYADHLCRLGKHAEALHEAKFARELDPLSLIANFMVAWVLFFAREYDDAVLQARRTLELDSHHVPAYRVLGWACEEKGDANSAIAAHHKAGTISGGNPGFRGQLGRAYALADRVDEAREVLNELIGLSSKQPISALDIGILHAALGETDDAFEWLARACDEHDDHVVYLKVNPRVDRLRPDVRFQALLERLRLA